MNKIYFSRITFFNKREITDFWITLDDMMSYMENIEKDGVMRAEAFILTPADEYSVRYDNSKCVYEYDVNGNYFYDIA